MCHSKPILRILVQDIFIRSFIPVADVAFFIVLYSAGGDASVVKLMIYDAM